MDSSVLSSMQEISKLLITYRVKVNETLPSEVSDYKLGYSKVISNPRGSLHFQCTSFHSHELIRRNICLMNTS